MGLAMKCNLFVDFGISEKSEDVFIVIERKMGTATFLIKLKNLSLEEIHYRVTLLHANFEFWECMNHFLFLFSICFISLGLFARIGRNLLRFHCSSRLHKIYIQSLSYFKMLFVCTCRFCWCFHFGAIGAEAAAAAAMLPFHKSETAFYNPTYKFFMWCFSFSTCLNCFCL